MTGKNSTLMLKKSDAGQNAGTVVVPKGKQTRNTCCGSMMTTRRSVRFSTALCCRISLLTSQESNAYPRWLGDSKKQATNIGMVVLTTYLTDVLGSCLQTSKQLFLISNSIRYQATRRRWLAHDDAGSNSKLNETAWGIVPERGM